MPSVTCVDRTQESSSVCSMLWQHGKSYAKSIKINYTESNTSGSSLVSAHFGILKWLRSNDAYAYLQQWRCVLISTSIFLRIFFIHKREFTDNFQETLSMFSFFKINLTISKIFIVLFLKKRISRLWSPIFALSNKNFSENLPEQDSWLSMIDGQRNSLKSVRSLRRLPDTGA